MNKKHLIVCNDAGSAFMMASYFFYSKKKFITVLTGPAIKVFKQFNLKYKNFDKKKLKNLVKQSIKVYTGTGWQTNLEKKAIFLSKKNGVNVTSFVDHWVNYETRFLLNKKKFLPDEIFVNNKKAANLLNKNSFFRKSKVTIITNFYKKYILEKTSKIRYSRNNKLNLLFISEPFLRKIHGFSTKDIILELAKYLNKNFKRKIILSIRMHPSQRLINFKFIKKIKYKNISLKISNQNNLEQDIMMNKLIIGCNSYALLVSLWLNKKTFYFFNIKGMKSVLKNKKIKNFKNFKIN